MATVLVGNAAHRGAGATASAYATGIQQYAEARTYDSTGTGPNFTSGGGFTVGAVTSDELTGVAFTATNNSGYTGSGPALASVTNSGTLSVLAGASAVADNVALAYAGATAIDQYALGSSAVATVVNTLDANITASANAFASGQNGASATAYALGIQQDAIARNTHTSRFDFGTGTLHLTSEGGTTSYGTLTTARTVIGTNMPSGPAVAMVDNSGAIDVSAHATAIVAQSGPAVGATSTTPAYAWAGATGIDQYARGSDALVEVDNSGSIAVDVGAVASGAVTSASASASAVGIHQSANAVGTVVTNHYQLGTVTFTESGHVETSTLLLPTATTFTYTNVGPAKAVVNNTGSIDVAAVATAVAGTAAYGYAYATGIDQHVAGATASALVTNTADASINVLASASASGTFASASVDAVGVHRRTVYR